MSDIYLINSNKLILQAMQRAGFNVTTCGQCGEIKLCTTSINELECEYCGMTGDICEFPDLYVVEI